MPNHIQNPKLAGDIGFYIHDGGSPGAFEEFGRVFDIPQFPDQQTDQVDVTHMRSPNRKREYIGGFIESGECQVQLAYEPGSSAYSALHALHVSGEVRQMKFVFGTNSGDPNETFAGYVSGIARAVPLGDKMTATVTIKVSGASTFGVEP